MYSLADWGVTIKRTTCICGHVAMFVSKLPPKPDFDMLAAAAPASADRRTFVLAGT
jgi:hypothetical protein